MSGESTSQTVTTTANGSSSSRQDLHVLQNEQLNSELKNLVGILTGKGGINLEQLLSGTHSSRPQLKPSTPTHPQPTVVPSPSHSTTPNYPATLATRKRGRTFDFDADSTKRRRGTVGAQSYSTRQSGEKQHNKGLRHFSQRVCEKVREKGATTYNEVADELVKELAENERSATSEPIDHKNIRRRVYDALNVLMAMNIISKEKKEIKWLGLPTNSAQECQHIEAELEQAEERIQTKQSEVEDLLIQILSFKNLMKRNRERVANLGAPSQNSAISLPFLVVNTSKKTTIDCSISSDKSEYVFSFDNAFELHNDIDVLKKMGLDCGLHTGQCTADDLRLAKSMLPKGFESTVDEIAQGKKLVSVNACPTTPSSSSSSLQLTSTPANPLSASAAVASPSSLSPLLNSQASPLALAAAFNQLKAAVAASPIGAANSPGQNAGSSLLNLSSPQAVTALVNEALKGAKSAQLASNLQTATLSPGALHSNQHGFQTNPMSPLLKSVGAASPVSVGATPCVPIPNGSPHLTKSPGPKIVTVSKLPATMTTQNDQLTSLLQTLQQHSSIPLLKPATTTGTNGHLSGSHTSAQSSSNGVM